MNLHYCTDQGPGIQRKLLRGKFVYFDPDGKKITAEEELTRIRTLVIPPAYQEVWISPNPLGHIQATGRDARGRKQYRYHAHWRKLRDADKYAQLRDFGHALPKIRQRIEQDLALPSLPRAKILATVVRLLDATLIRVGNEEYARSNKSYGLTTLRNRHVDIEGSAIRFHFRGKSGVEHDVRINDPRLARILRRCVDIPGQALFQYLDDDGARCPVSSADVNAYLQELSAGTYTAKDYRTWAGSVLAFSLLQGVRFDAADEARQHIVEVVKQVSQRLGNTPAVCRKCYIHPAVLESFVEGGLQELSSPKRSSKLAQLNGDERRFLAFMERVKA